MMKAELGVMPLQSQGMPKAADNTTEPEQAKKDSPAGLRAWNYQHFDFRLPELWDSKFLLL